MSGIKYILFIFKIKDIIYVFNGFSISLKSSFENIFIIKEKREINIK